MYEQAIAAGASARLTLDPGNGGDPRTVELYSPDGVKFVAGLWVKLAAQFRLMYEPSWLGIPIIQVPSDIVMMQELLWRLRPDWIIECGVAHGGAAVLYASICELAGKGRVLGVDCEIRKYNRVAIEAHPLAPRIELLEGSSIDPAVAAEVSRRTAGGQRRIVVLDSNHSAEHVLEEMNLYAGLVTPGSYLVVMDGAQADVADVPRGKPEWAQSHPVQAIIQFLSQHPEFCNDPHYTRMHITSCPMGFLRRRNDGGAE